MPNPRPDAIIGTLEFHSLLTRATPIFLAVTVGAAGKDVQPLASASEWHPISLATFYTSTFAQIDQNPAGGWANAPHGKQAFESIPFDLQGIMEVAGLRPAREKRLHPTSINGIPVGHKATRLHLLHGAGESLKDGTPIAKLVLHYADGSQRSLPIVYGRNVRNWYKPRDDTDTVTDPNTRAVWHGSSPDSSRYGMTLRLFLTSFNLPESRQEIRSLDLVSLLSESVSVVTGITLEEGPSGAARAEVAQALGLDESKLRTTAMVLVTAAENGKPIAGARLRLAVSDADRDYQFGEQHTDAAGRSVLEFPAQTITRLSLIASAPGYALRTFNAKLQDLPAHWIELKLEPGLTMGGRVQDAAGRRLSGVKLIINQTVKDDVGQTVLSEIDTVVTDAQGAWQCASLPRTAAQLNFALSHPKFIPGEYDEAAPSDGIDNFVTRADLLAGKAVMKMSPGISVAGKVETEQGQPIAQASVRLVPREESSDRPPQTVAVRTDKLGAFEIVRFATGLARLIVSAPGFAPQQEADLEVKPGLEPRRFVLKPGATLKGRVTAQYGTEGLLAKVASALVPQAASQSAQPESQATVRATWNGELQTTNVIRLQKWGRIEGVAKAGTKPWADQEILLTDTRAGRQLNYEWTSYKVTTDATGRFALDNVPPGERQVVRLVKQREGSWRHCDTITVSVKPGETTHALVGGAGRPVIGRILLSEPNANVDFNRGFNLFSTRFPQPPPEYRTANRSREWQRTPEFQAALKKQHSYGLRINDDGSFRIENVVPGAYDLRIQLQEPGPQPYQFGKLIGSLTREIVIAEIPGGVSDEPLDLGRLPIQAASR